MDIPEDIFEMPGNGFSLDDFDKFSQEVVNAIANDDTPDRNLGSLHRNSFDCNTLMSYSLGDYDMDYMSLESTTNNMTETLWSDLDTTRPADLVFSDLDQRDEFKLVSPNAIFPMHSSIPSSSMLDIPSFLESYYDLDVQDIYREVVNDPSGQIIKEDKWLQSRGRPVYHMDNDHCYSARPPREQQEVVKVKVEDDYFVKSPPCSPSSCSDVDVETISQPPVPKIKITVTPVAPVSRVTPVVPVKLVTPVTQKKRGRKPQSIKTEERVKKRRTQNYESGINPKYLMQALKKKKYVTKSGRVTKITNSLETSPSSSASSSQHSSRCSSDCEETVDKRASHNMAERNRRQELTKLFQALRRKVPQIKKNTKASKVLILQSARNHVRELETSERQHLSSLEQLKAQLERKMALLESLTLKNTIKVEPRFS